MTTSRCLLHKSKLNDFKIWLTKKGWYAIGAKGDYEVLRMRHLIYGILLIYDRNNAIEHYTTYGIGNRLVRQYIKDKKCKS